MENQEVKGIRGGKREGAGRKPGFLNSDKFRQELSEACGRKAQETGHTLADQLVDIAWSDDKRSKMPALRLIYDKLISQIKESESGGMAWNGPIKYPKDNRDEFMAAVGLLQDAGVLPQGGVFLPKERTDPAKVVPFKAGGGA